MKVMEHLIINYDKFKEPWTIHPEILNKKERALWNYYDIILAEGGKELAKITERYKRFEILNKLIYELLFQTDVRIEQVKMPFPIMELYLKDTLRPERPTEKLYFPDKKSRDRSIAKHDFPSVFSIHEEPDIHFSLAYLGSIVNFFLFNNNRYYFIVKKYDVKRAPMNMVGFEYRPKVRRENQDYKTDNGYTIPIYDLHQVAQKLRSFFVNFIYFLEEPDVILIDSSKVHSRGRRWRRKLGDVPTTIVKIKGELKKYVRDLAQEKKKYSKFTHRFWVRGHWRHYTTERYSKQRTWVKPYIKGRGILIDKKYQVEKKEED